MVHQKELSSPGYPLVGVGKAGQAQLFLMNLILAFFLYFLAQPVLAQTGRLSGKIVGTGTEAPLSEIHVFIPNTSFQAFSDGEGNFLLANLPEGTWELQVRGPGWEKFSQQIQVKAGLPVRLSIRLNKESEPALNPENLSKSKITKLTEAVKEAFVGKGLAAEQIQFLNPDKVIFEEQQDKSYRVRAEGPLFFSNTKTGYLVSVYFDPFILGLSKPSNPFYSYFELPKEEGTEAARRAARLETYQSSPTFFLAQLMEGKTTSFPTPADPEVAFTSQPGVYQLSFTKPLKVSLADGTQGTLDYSGEKLLVHLNGSPVAADQLAI